MLVSILGTVLQGLLSGMVYGLMALGLSVIFGVVRVVNFAHGEMMVLAMYAAYLINAESGLDPLLALPLVTLALFCLGYGLQRGLINRFIARPDNQQFLLLLAIATILTASLLIGFGPDARNVQVDYAYDSFELGPLLLDKVRVIAALGALLAVAALWGFFRFTRTGKSIRACADNQIGAAVVGLDVKRLYALTFGIGAACVGAAGCLMLLLVDVQPYVAADYTLLAFIIVILGGLGSMPGAMLGGVIVGVAEALSARFIEPSFKSAISFALLILVLLVRPQGLLGRA
jgi:branched-chain amino acid transport system permease protein